MEISPRSKMTLTALVGMGLSYTIIDKLGVSDETLYTSQGIMYATGAIVLYQLYKVLTK